MKNKLRKTVLSQLTSQEPETKAEIDKNLLEKLIALPAYKIKGKHIEKKMLDTYMDKNRCYKTPKF